LIEAASAARSTERVMRHHGCAMTICSGAAIAFLKDFSFPAFPSMKAGFHEPS
jgi:hypothetical protein